MDKMEQLVRLRDAVASPDGQAIVKECYRFIVEVASKSNSNAEWVKGMGLLVNRLLSVDQECRQLFANNKEP